MSEWVVERHDCPTMQAARDELTVTLQAAKVDRVVVEAMGGYERRAVCAMQSSGLSVARVNPRQARDFAKAMGAVATTDQVEARSLCAFADVLARHADRTKYITPMVKQARTQLAELMTRRRQLVDMRLNGSSRDDASPTCVSVARRGLTSGLPISPPGTCPSDR